MRTRTMGCVSAFKFLALLVVLFVVPARADETVEDVDGNGNVFVTWATDTNYPWVYNMDFANTQHVHQATYALQVDYDKTHVDEFNPYNESHAIFSFLGGWNFRNYDYLSFWVYQETNKTLQFRMKLEDKFGVRNLITTNGMGVPVTNVIGYWESGWASMEPKVTNSGWANIAFDLTRIFSADNSGNVNKAQIDLGNIRQIMFIVQPGTNGIATNDVGRFWMDDMKLSRGPNPAPLDIFENDFYGWSTPVPGTFAAMTLTNEASYTNIGSRSLKLAWTNKPNGNWDYIGYATAHDAATAPTGRVGNYMNLNLRGNTNLRMWVKSGGNVPVLAKIDGAELGTQTYTGAGAWQQLSWGYGTNVGKVSVTNILFFPFPGTASTGGVMYLDDLILDGGSAPTLPAIVTGLKATPIDLNDSSDFGVSWINSGANNYELLESVNNVDFGSAQAFYPSGTNVDMLDKSPQRYFYSVRSNLKSGTNDNYGAFCKPISFSVSKQTTYDPAAAFQGLGDADNGTFATECAEFDNVSAKFFMPGLKAFRVEVTHPSAQVGALDVRHVDFGPQGSLECQADPDTNRINWIGVDNGGYGELLSKSYSSLTQEVFYRDDATYSSLQMWTNFPAQLGGSVTAQVIVFTADAGIPPTNFAYFTVDFADVSGSLAVDVFACNDYAPGMTNWTNMIASFTATAANHQHGLGVPAGTFTKVEANKNAFKLRVNTNASSQGAIAHYDDINYQPADVNLGLYDDGIVVISAVRSGGWWREYKGSGSMAVEVLGGGTVSNVHVVEIARKAYDITKWYGFMVMYEDGNMRLAPQPPMTENWIPYGPSVIMGPIQDLDEERPFTDVKRLVIDPKDFSVDVTYENNETAHFEMYVDRNRAVLDVTDIGYTTTGSNPFTIMRSMWVLDGKSDIDTVYTAIDHKSMLNWTDLDGTWWQFARDVASYHNTLSPDELISAISPTLAYLVQQAESGYSATGAVVATRTNAVGTQVLNMSSNGAASTWALTLTNTQLKSSVRLRYSDYVGGNEVTIYFDGVLKDSIFSQSTAGWSSFELTPEIKLGDVSSGTHTLKVTTASGTEGVNIDQVELVSYASTAPVPSPAYTVETENFATKASTCQMLTNGAASSNKYILVDKTGGWLEYAITTTNDLLNPYIRFRYSDGEGAVSGDFDDGIKSRDDRVDVKIDGQLKCRLATFTTGGWTNFVNGQTAYLDNTLVAGVHTVRVEVGVASRLYANVISTNNPGFESGSASPWTATGATIAATTVAKHQGTYGGKLTLSTAGSGTAYQEVNPADYGLHTGDEATASAWIKTDLGMGTAGACIQLEFLNGATVVGSKTSYIFLNPADWELMKVSDAIPSGTTKIRTRLSLLNGQNGNYAYFDDAGLDLYGYPGSATNACSLDKFEILPQNLLNAAPTYAPNGGVYNGAVTAKLSSVTAGATIYYTTNGSTPTISSPSVTNGGLIVLTQPYSNIVKAFAVKAGQSNSTVSASPLFRVGTGLQAVYGSGAVPGVIQAEDFDYGGEGIAYHDTDAANNGGAYRTADGVDIESTSDTGGGYNVGWLQQGEWMEYTVNVNGDGFYSLSLRMANPDAGARMHVEIDGVNVSGNIIIPDTDGWQNWSNVAAGTVALSTGEHLVRIACDTNSGNGSVGNFNYFQLATNQSPYSGAWSAIPGNKIQAEDFDKGGEAFAYHDDTGTNLGGAYRPSEGVDIESTSDAGGGYNVAWLQQGEWMEYSVKVIDGGSYSLILRMANPDAGGRMHVEMNGVNVSGNLSVPDTDGWQNWTNVTVSSLSLTEGVYVVRVACDTNSGNGSIGNFNYIQFISNQSAYTGTNAVVPGTIQAENFDVGGEASAYHDTGSNNIGGAFRTSEGVDIESTLDTSGVYNVGWMQQGEWMEYTVNVQTTAWYVVCLRVANPDPGATVHVEVDRVNLTGTINVPDTDGWQTWTNVMASSYLSLTAGVHVVRVACDANSSNGSVGNMNFIKFVQNTAPVASNKTVTATEDAATNITLVGSDAQTTNLAYLVNAAAYGTITGTPPNVTYIPVQNYNGSDSFTFRVSDGVLTSSLATVSINVNGVNDAPVANGQSVYILRNTCSNAVTLTGTDVETNTLTYAVVASPTNGTLTGAAPNVKYTPTNWFYGTDSFTFRVNDATLTSGPATVTLTVTQSYIYVNAAYTGATENGTAAYPYNTLAEGVAVATNPGVTLMVASGRYSGVSFTSRTNIWVLGDTEKALVANGTVFSVSGCNFMRFEGFTVTGSVGSIGFSITGGSTNILVTRNTVRDLSRDNAGYGGAFAGADSTIQIVDNVISNVYGGQMGGGGYFSSCNLWVESNDFINCTAWAAAGGLRLIYGAAGYSTRIRNNYFSGNVADYSGAIAVGEHTAIDFLMIDHNIIVGSGSDYQYGGAISINMWFGTGTVQVLNNVIKDPVTPCCSSSVGLYVTATSDVYVANNIFYGGAYSVIGNAKTRYDYNDRYSGLLSGVTSGSGNITNNPNFTNPGAGDYTLQTNSACINAGNTNAFYNDANGTRNDMGAFGGNY